MVTSMEDIDAKIRHLKAPPRTLSGEIKEQKL